MTTGAISPNVSSNPDGSRKSNPYRYKQWSGTNDPSHTIEQSYRMDSLSVSFVECHYLGTPVTFVARGLPDFTTFKGLNTSIGGNTALLALSRLNAQIKGHSFNAAAAFADVEKTGELLANACINAIEAYNALKRRDYVDFVRRLPQVVKGDPKGSGLAREMKRGDIPSIWLAAQYGWRPLISDISDAFDAFTALRQKTRRVKFKASAKGEPYKVSLGYSGIGGPYTTVTEKVAYRLELKENLTTAQSLGLVPLGLFTVAWERVPFSFVLDWFIPIGSTIEQYAFFSSLTYSLSKTSFRSHSGFNDKLVATGTPSTDKYWSLGSSTVTGVNLLREINQNIGLIAPNFKSLGKALTSTHLLNAAALIWSALEGSSPSRLGSGFNRTSRVGRFPF